MLKKVFSFLNIKQFISYFFVGGVAAIVEWIAFFALSSIFDIYYISATCIAFIFSTTTNLVLGKLWTFKDNDNYRNKKIKETVLVFLVSAIGLLFNMLLMYIFVEFLRLDTDIMKTFGKIFATGIVFIWNYLARKLFIYK